MKFLYYFILLLFFFLYFLVILDHYQIFCESQQPQQIDFFKILDNEDEVDDVTFLKIQQSYVDLSNSSNSTTSSTSSTSSKPPTTTPNPSTVSTTSISTTSTNTVTPSYPPCYPIYERKFDFPSFLGGIILACGLASICYGIIRYNQIEKLKRQHYYNYNNNNNF